MVEASQAAKRLAAELDLDVSTVTGTGKDGLITQDDVRKAGEAAAQSNVMTKQRLARVENAENGGLPENKVHVPSTEEMLAIIQELQKEVTGLREAQAGMIERENLSRDLTDDMFFIAKPNGNRWEERRVIDGKTVSVEFAATAFYGPFKDEAMINEYIEAKKSKRVDAFIDWQNVSTMTGREARELDYKETQERETHFTSSAPVNILDRKIFAQKTAGNVPGVGQVVESADKAGPAPFNRANAAR